MIRGGTQKVLIEKGIKSGQGTRGGPWLDSPVTLKRAAGRRPEGEA
jgi:hypothetical protein